MQDIEELTATDLDNPARRPVGWAERGLDDIQDWGLMLGGAAAAVYGISQRSLGGLFMAGVGAGLAWWGAQRSGLLGADPKRLIVNTGPQAFIRLDSAITVDRPIDEVYAFWRDLPNLARFMHHIKSVEQLDRGRSRWHAEIPGLGVDLCWDAQLVDERPDDLLVWQSVAGSEIHNQGYVSFTEGPADGETTVHVEIQYQVPGGQMARRAVEFIDGLTDDFVQRDLERFRAVIEEAGKPHSTATAQAAETPEEMRD